MIGIRMKKIDKPWLNQNSRKYLHADEVNFKRKLHFKKKL